MKKWSGQEKVTPRHHQPHHPIEVLHPLLISNKPGKTARAGHVRTLEREVADAEENLMKLGVSPPPVDPVLIRVLHELGGDQSTDTSHGFGAALQAVLNAAEKRKAAEALAANELLDGTLNEMTYRKKSRKSMGTFPDDVAGPDYMDLDDNSNPSSTMPHLYPSPTQSGNSDVEAKVNPADLSKLSHDVIIELVGVLSLATSALI